MCHPERRAAGSKSKDPDPHKRREGGGIPLPSALPYRHARGNLGCHPERSPLGEVDIRNLATCSLS